MNHEINRERFLDSLLEMGQIGKNGKGVNRLALNDSDKKARDRLIEWFREENLEVLIDPIGNISGLRKGKDKHKPPVMVGSHLDTVKKAGIYDGALGVLAGLAIIRYLNQEDIQTNQSVAVTSFTNEEGARFQPDMMGSMVCTGKLDPETAYKAKDDDGITVKEELQRIGYLGKDRIFASHYLELHVEQGPILHSENLQIGVVEGVQGMAWWDAEYFGEANHAGTTPLHLRKDALLATAETCVKIREIAERIGNETVVTMGRLQLKPDIRNVIPSSTFFTIDFRQYKTDLYEAGQKTIVNQIKETTKKHGLEYTLTKTVDAKPVKFQNNMVSLIEEKTRQLGFNYKRMHSGAGHDAQFMTHICPTAMIFVPSINGKSHSPEEFTTKNDCINGANLLLNCVLDLANHSNM